MAKPPPVGDNTGKQLAASRTALGHGLPHGAINMPVAQEAYGTQTDSVTG